MTDKRTKKRWASRRPGFAKPAHEKSPARPVDPPEKAEFAVAGPTSTNGYTGGVDEQRDSFLHRFKQAQEKLFQSVCNTVACDDSAGTREWLDATFGSRGPLKALLASNGIERASRRPRRRACLQSTMEAADHQSGPGSAPMRRGRP